MARAGRACASHPILPAQASALVLCSLFLRRVSCAGRNLATWPASPANSRPRAGKRQSSYRPRFSDRVAAAGAQDSLPLARARTARCGFPEYSRPHCSTRLCAAHWERALKSWAVGWVTQPVAAEEHSAHSCRDAGRKRRRQTAGLSEEKGWRAAYAPPNLPNEWPVTILGGAT